MSPEDRATLRAVCGAGSEHATVLLTNGVMSALFAAAGAGTAWVPKAVVLALLDLADRAEPMPEHEPAEGTAAL
jgi:hypothetical protein